MSILENLLAKPGQDRSAYAPFWPEESIVKSIKPIKQSTSTLTSTSWNLGFFKLEDFHFLADEVSALAAKSIESNIFLEPEFLQSGIQRIEDKGVMLVCLWEGNPGAQVLRFFMPVVATKSGIPRYRIMRSFTHHFAPLGTPLIHRDNAPEIAENLLRLLGDPELSIPAVIAFEQQRLDGPGIQILIQAAEALGLQHNTVLSYQRANLQAIDTGNMDPQTFIRRSLGKKRLKEYARLLRRLGETGETGEITFDIARTENSILDAIEGFLTLEAGGWKGRSGTALYSLKQIAAFSRQAVSALAKANHCEIHSMKSGDKIIASLICFKTKGEYFTWKIAFDEDYNSYSPGVQIMLKATEYWLGKKAFVCADSLASANHSMIDHLWRDRLDLGTLLIEIGESKTGRFTKTGEALERYENTRNLAKSIIARIKLIF